MEENILEIVEKFLESLKKGVKYLSHREIVEKSYGDLWDDIRKTAVILRNNGLCGTHIALVGSSSYEWICAYMAILFTGNTTNSLQNAHSLRRLFRYKFNMFMKRCFIHFLNLHEGQVLPTVYQPQDLEPES